MFTSENILCVEFSDLNERLIKVTYKNKNNVYVDQFQNNPKKLEFKTLIAAGWNLKKIRDETKRLEKLKDKPPSVQQLERIANGYAWAKEEVENVRKEKDDLYLEHKKVAKDIQTLYLERENIIKDLKKLYLEHEQAGGTLKSLYKEGEQAGGTLKNVYQEHDQARLNLEKLYSEYQSIRKNLDNLYGEHINVKDNLDNIYGEKKLAQIESEEARKRTKEAMEGEMDKLQQTYEKYQHLYGMNLMNVIFTDNDNKEIVFKTKLELLNRPEIKSESKEFKSKIRKAKTIKDILKVLV